MKTIIDAGSGIAGGAARQGLDLLRKAQHLRPSPKRDMDDRTLKAKVESVVFGSAGVKKGDINVTVVDRQVTLHGKARNAAAIKAIEAAVSAIPEVAGVDNLLAQQGSTSRKAPAKRATPRKATTRGRVNREVKSTTKAEPAPKELAKQGKGRQPAPMGTKETPSTGSGLETPGAKVDAALAATKTTGQSASPVAETTRGASKSGAKTGAKTKTAAAKDATKSAAGTKS